jgi:hypothetical protein
MKHLICILVVVAVLAGLSTASAQTNAFTTKLKGTITTDAGKISIHETDLLKAPTNELVLVIDVTGNWLGLYDVSGTNVVQDIASTWRSAMLNNGMFNGDLEWDSLLTNTPVAAHPFNSDIQATGKAKLKNGQIQGASVSLAGAWTDPNRDGMSNYPAAIFKGKLSTVEAIPVPAGY